MLHMHAQPRPVCHLSRSRPRAGHAGSITESCPNIEGVMSEPWTISTLGSAAPAVSTVNARHPEIRNSLARANGALSWTAP